MSGPLTLCSFGAVGCERHSICKKLSLGKFLKARFMAVFFRRVTCFLVCLCIQDTNFRALQVPWRNSCLCPWVPCAIKNCCKGSTSNKKRLKNTGLWTWSKCASKLMKSFLSQVAHWVVLISISSRQTPNLQCQITDTGLVVCPFTPHPQFLLVLNVPIHGGMARLRWLLWLVTCEDSLLLLYWQTPQY